MVYNSFSMGVKYMKCSELVAWNGKSFTYGYLVFQPTKHREIKLKSNTSYIAVTTLSNSENIPHINLIQDSFKIESKVMETSDSMAWEFKSLTYGFRPTEHRDMKLQINTSYIVFTKSSNS